MTEKVKLPQGVANAIQRLRNADYTNYGIVTLVGGLEVLYLKTEKEIIRSWTFGDGGNNAELLLDALVNGYEVEPEYKVGDWILDEYGRLGVIKRIALDGTYFGEGFRVTHKMIKRHATPEEIKVEKERRLWKKIGREPDQFILGDSFENINGLIFPYDRADRIGEIMKMIGQGKFKGFYPAESFISFEDDSNP